MQGFIYIWHDKTRNMFYIGSHDGTPDDGYISSSRWLSGEIRYRPTEFRRKIIKFLPLSQLKKEEYRLIKMIKHDEYGKKYYNIKSGQKQGFEPWNKGKTGIFSKEALEKMSNAKKGNSHTKGKFMPTAAENGKKSAKKQSLTVTGRKRKYLPNGSWIWVYPNGVDCLVNKEQSTNPHSITV